MARLPAPEITIPHWITAVGPLEGSKFYKVIRKNNGAAKMDALVAACYCILSKVRIDKHRHTEFRMEKKILTSKNRE